MGLVGISLAIWRWPWQEDSKEHDPQLYAPNANASIVNQIERTRLQYRRGWWAERLKYGPAESFDEKGRLVARQIWQDDQLHGPEAWFDMGGHPIVEQHWRQGVLAGPFRYGDGFRWSQSGQYRNGEREGECRDDEQWCSGHTIERVAQWSNDRLHGNCQWQVTETGEVLQRGIFEQGTLIELNGQPVRDYLREWAHQGRIENQDTANDLLSQGVADTSRYQFDGIWRRRIERDPTLHPSFEPTYVVEPNDAVSVSLLNSVLPWGLAIDERYGQLWLVPAEDIGLWQDPTGVDRIVPPKNSKLADAWNAPHAHGEHGLDGNEQMNPLECIYENWPQGTEVVVDLATHFPKLDAQWNTEERQRRRGTRRGDSVAPSLRHWLGRNLYLAGLQCELQGNRLVILPHWSSRR